MMVMLIPYSNGINPTCMYACQPSLSPSYLFSFLLSHHPVLVPWLTPPHTLAYVYFWSAGAGGDKKGGTMGVSPTRGRIWFSQCCPPGSHAWVWPCPSPVSVPSIHKSQEFSFVLNASHFSAWPSKCQSYVLITLSHDNCGFTQWCVISGLKERASWCGRKGRLYTSYHAPSSVLWWSGREATVHPSVWTTAHARTFMWSPSPCPALQLVRTFLVTFTTSTTVTK